MLKGILSILLLLLLAGCTAARIDVTRYSCHAEIHSFLMSADDLDASVCGARIVAADVEVEGEVMMTTLPLLIP